MSFRGPDQNVIEIIRTLQERVDLLERGTGSVRQNTIRMGNWVLEPVDDALVKMTNLVTGVESYIGAPSDSTPSVVIGELPPFHFGGLIRNSFVDDMTTGHYIVDGAGTVTRIDVTLHDTDTAGVNSGPIFRVWNNDVIVFTSPRITANETVLTTSLPFTTGDNVYCSISDDGIGDAVTLTIMMRFG